VIITPPGYFDRVQAILTRYDVLVLVDEVITGFGRLGQLFGTQVYGLKPDMITVAKMLISTYVPMSALYLTDEIYQVIADTSAAVGMYGHGYTYGGHPVACAEALEALRIYESDNLVSHVQKVGPRLQQGPRRMQGHAIVGDVRGPGPIGAIELAADPARRKPFDPKRGVGAYFVRCAQVHGLIVRVLGGDVFAFSPRLVITKSEIDALIQRAEFALADTWAWVISRNNWARPANDRTAC
jgi:4-aminobutyrate--pyruvate transaminase